MPTYIYWVDTTVEHGLNELIDEDCYQNDTQCLKYEVR
jgi:hypothetical protein